MLTATSGLIKSCKASKVVYIKNIGGWGGRRVLQIFQKIFCGPEEHRAKYFMAQ